MIPILRILHGTRVYSIRQFVSDLRSERFETAQNINQLSELRRRRQWRTGPKGEKKCDPCRKSKQKASFSICSLLTIVRLFRSERAMWTLFHTWNSVHGEAIYPADKTLAP